MNLWKPGHTPHCSPIWEPALGISDSSKRHFPPQLVPESGEKRKQWGWNDQENRRVKGIFLGKWELSQFEIGEEQFSSVAQREESAFTIFLKQLINHYSSIIIRVVWVSMYPNSLWASLHSLKRCSVVFVPPCHLYQLFLKAFFCFLILII